MLKGGTKSLLLNISIVIIMSIYVVFCVKLIYEFSTTESYEYQMLNLGFFLTLILCVSIFYSDYKGPEGRFFDIIRKRKSQIMLGVIIALFAIVPLFILLANIIIFLLTMWYYWLTIMLVILLLSVLFSEINYLQKIIITILAVGIIYFLSGAKDILIFNLDVYFDKEKLLFFNYAG